MVNKMDIIFRHKKSVDNQLIINAYSLWQRQDSNL